MTASTLPAFPSSVFHLGGALGAPFDDDKTMPLPTLTGEPTRAQLALDQVSRYGTATPAELEVPPTLFSRATKRSSAAVQSMRVFQAINVLLSPPDGPRLGVPIPRTVLKHDGLGNHRKVALTDSAQRRKHAAIQGLCKALNHVTTVFFDGHGECSSYRNLSALQFNGCLIKPSMQRHAVLPERRSYHTLFSGVSTGRART